MQKTKNPKSRCSLCLKENYISQLMHMQEIVYAVMDAKGNFFHSCRFPTCEKELIAHVNELDAGKKILTLEESSLTYWISRTIHP